MLVRKARPNKYLKEFIEYCKEEYKDNLLAIVIYGSYAWGYFDKRESDYDIIILFKKELPSTKEKAQKYFKKKFPKISLQYFNTEQEMIERAHFGHWTSYITLLKSSKALYSTKEYKKFLKKLKKINLLEKMFDVAGVEAKTISRMQALKKLKGFKAAKWALPSIRVQLQMLTYIKHKKLLWNLRRNLKKNKKILTAKEISFIKKLDNKVKTRSSDFTKEEKEISLNILSKLNREIISNLF